MGEFSLFEKGGRISLLVCMGEKLGFVLRHTKEIKTEVRKGGKKENESKIRCIILSVNISYCWCWCSICIMV
jgi:hypothetical protein